MGTSTRLTGPSGQHWQNAARALTKSLNNLEKELTNDYAGSNNGKLKAQDNPDTAPTIIERLSDAEAEHHADNFLAALRAELSINRDRFDLYKATDAAARRLIDTLESINNGKIHPPKEFDQSAPEEQKELFVEQFVNEVAASTGLPIDAIVRSAITDTADKLLEQSPVLNEAIKKGGAAHGSITDRIFCMLYQNFFVSIITNFLKTVITAKMTLMFPILPTVDPANNISDWVSKKVVALVPTPCEQEEKSGDSLADLGKSLIRDAFDKAIGLQPGV